MKFMEFLALKLILFKNNFRFRLKGDREVFIKRAYFIL